MLGLLIAAGLIAAALLISAVFIYANLYYDKVKECTFLEEENAQLKKQVEKYEELASIELPSSDAASAWLREKAND